MKTKKEEKKKFDLEEAFVLWLKKSKAGTEYVTGHDLNDNRMIGFFNTNKTNDKQPDLELFEVDKEGKKGEKVVSLWTQESKDKKEYLSGTSNENEKIIAFYGEIKENDKRPYIKGYFKED